LFILIRKVKFFGSIFYYFWDSLSEKYMKILIIDNYDSFTYNIAHYVEQFADACEVIKIDQIRIKDIHAFDKIILSPGPGLPNERPIQNKIIKTFYKSKSFLGICLGHQALAEYFGSKLFNMNEVHHGVARDTKITVNDYLWRNTSPNFKSGRYHSWTIDSDTISEELEIIATDIESETIMAFRHKKYDIRGIQFHPESILTENGLQIIKNWVLK